MSKALQTSSAEPASTISSSLTPGVWLHTHSIGVRVAIVGALLGFAFWPILIGIYGSWFDEHAYMEHGILVVPAALYMVWTKRAALSRIAPRASAWGLAILLFGGVQALIATAAQWIWVSRVAFLVSLVGCIVALYGFELLRSLVYPLGTLLLMLAPPSFVFERLTLSLQLLASRLAELFLEAFGYSVLREGNVLELVGMKLSVAEACSGIRSLLGILFICVLYNFLFVRGRTMKTLILMTAIPIAMLGNAARIVATGIASQYNRELVYGTAHEAFGWVSITLAALGCIAVHLMALYVGNSWRRIHHA
jgi:exosortase